MGKIVKKATPVVGKKSYGKYQLKTHRLTLG